MRSYLLVFMSFFVVPTSVFGQQRNDFEPDAVFYDGKVITVDRSFGIQEAFAVRGDEFLAVGRNAKVRALAGKNTRQVDLHGSAVIPGLSDNHDHLYDSARYMRPGVDMVGVTVPAEFYNRLRQAVAAAKPGETVFTTTGWAFRPGPTRKDLDAVSTEVPIVVIGFRRGNGALNSAALKLAGITKESPSFEGTPVQKDASGEPTGAIPGYPAAILLIDKLLPQLSDADEEELILSSQHQRSALGITSVRDLQLWPRAENAYYRLWRQGKLTLRVSMGIEFPDQANSAQNLALLGVGAGFGDHWLRFDSLSEEPWAPAFPLKQFTDLAMAMNRLGWRPAPHVNADPFRGIPADETLNDTLEAYEAADRDSPIHDRRWVVEHAPFATPEQMERLAKMGIIVSVQDAGYNGNLDPAIKSVGQERAENQNPLREFLDHHIVVVGGSDYAGPTPDEANPNNPFIRIYYYVTRKTKDEKVIGPKEKISREEALRIFTTNAAFATFEEKVKGSIEPGKLADFVILSQNILTVPEEQIRETHALATYVGGRKVFSAENSNF